MTNWVALCQAVRAFWSQAAPPREHRPADAAPVRSHIHVPPGYLSLFAYLDHRYASTVVLTFEQIESLLGFELPAPARTERGWWTAGAGHTDRYADAWIGAGRTAMPNLCARTVTFDRLP